MKKLNIVGSGSDWRARLLSNFAATPFRFGWISFVSVEGFIQGIKFPKDDPRREAAFAMSGVKAKRMSRKAARAHGRKFVWWWGRAITYGSNDHHRLIAEAIGAKVMQNPSVQRALRATEGMELIHDFGRPESKTTSLPARVFVRILTELRGELLAVEEVRK